jgi:signal transduction histidine kinase/ActR/RegA family two-component response regulator
MVVQREAEGAKAIASSGRAWRERLLERLLWTIAPLATLGYFLAVATSGSRRPWVVALDTLPIAACWLAAFKRRWSVRARGTILISALLLVAYSTYWISAFQGNASILVAVAVVMSGLLFGRRAVLLVLLIALAAPLSAAVAMKSGMLALPPPELVSPAHAAPWIRTTFVAVVLWTLLGVAVTYVVGHIERTLETEHGALVDLRAEQALREQAEQERREAERAALQAQKMELVGSLAAGVAHDFNNVLAVVQGWASMGLRPGASERARAEAAEALDAAARQGAALARQLLALGRHTVRTVGPCHIADIVETSAKALRRVLPEDVELTLGQDGDAWVEADETELQQLVFNLVINARDAMPAGGQLRVTTGIESWISPRAVFGGELAPGAWAFLTVRDTGTGISPAIQARIFEPFFTTKPAGTGTGLGLWTVLGIARAGGGGLAVESEVGAGACFRVFLPASARGAPRATPAPPLPTRARPARVLVLEDNEPVRRLMRDALAEWGHDVLAVSSGVEAEEAIRKSQAPFDLLCTDAVVPQLPARQVIEAFERARPDAPVLIVSGYVDEELTRRGIEQGRYRLLRKPFRPEDLTATVNELLGSGLRERGGLSESTSRPPSTRPS